MSLEENRVFMKEAIRLSMENVEQGSGGPFGAVIVKDGKIIAKGTNQVTAQGDPTAHAEIVAIRNACAVLQSFQLEGCDIYCSCEPCPMCLGAIHWARPDRVFFGAGKEDAAQVGFDDQFIYGEIAKPASQRKLLTRQLMRKEALAAFRKWSVSDNKIIY